MSKQKKIYSIGEMYCGPGGLGLGAKKTILEHSNKIVSFAPSWATDYDPDTCRTYAENIHNGDMNNVHCVDIRNIDLSILPYADGFMFGFPCNDFSLVGETKGLTGRFGPLYKYGVDYISLRNPLFFVAENVSGLSSANSGEAFRKVLSELNHAGDAGYNLTVNLFKFENYGVPQKRHRIIIVGFRADLKKFFHVPKGLNFVRTSSDGLLNPTIPEDALNQELTKQHPRVVERLNYIQAGQNAWNSDLPAHLQLNVKGARLSNIYRRLHPDQPSYTITGSGGGGTHVYHWDEPRALTNRERARLQSFPDDFIFYGSKESVRKQIGMAVPPVGAQYILKNVIAELEGVETEKQSPTHGFIGARSLPLS